VKIRVCLAALGVAACGVNEAPLVSPDLITGDAINQPLTNRPGDAARGETVFVGRDQGHCILCHQVNSLDAEFQGDVGPDLSFVGDRLSPDQLRLRLVDYQLVRPGTLMPSYYRIHDLYQVGEAYEDEAILSAQDIEDIVSYLSALKRVEDDE